MTILPNQSGEIRLTANLLDTWRRFAPLTKNGGEREGPAPAEAAVRKRETPEGERFRADLGEKKREKEEFFGRVEKERRR